MNIRKAGIIGSVALISVLITGCGNGRSDRADTSHGSSGTTPAERHHLDIFDDLDYNVFTNQKWNELSRSHAKDIAVHWPDGHVTHGLEKHLEDLKAMFVFAPDTRIKEHPIKIAQGDYTAVMGWMEGTFTKPMPLGDGKTAAPTGKSFRIPMCTIGHWKDGVMVEEFLFWDNQAFMKQIGLAE